MLSRLRYWFTWFNWKRRAKHRRRPSLKVGNLFHFFQSLNEAGIIYVVLRWFEEIPLTEDEEKSYDGDLDILLDSKDFKKFAEIVASHPGKTRIDLYSEGVQMGTGYARLPYFPPPKANEILENRELYKDAFFVPVSAIYLRSLCYHLTYHKGMLSGLDDGLSGKHNSIENHHPVEETLRSLAVKTGDVLPENMTLFSLHSWLFSQGWNMPYDLLARWGKKNEWHTVLQEYLENKLRNIQGRMRDILVFLVREDAMEKDGAAALIQQRLGEHFSIADVVDLTEEQQRRVMNQTRGADWTRHKSKLMVRPVRAIICHDPEPVAVSPDNPLGKIHFNVKNEHVFYKHELRDELEVKYPNAAANFLHGSDNDLESTAYLLAIYGDDKMDVALNNVLAVMKTL